MRFRFAAIATLCTAIAISLAAPAYAAQLQVTEAWARATNQNIPADQQESAAYLTLTNNGNDAVTVTGFATPAAGQAGAHQTVITGGIAKMVPFTPLIVQPHSQSILTMRGPHIMLAKLTGPLVPGDKMPLTLNYADNTSQTVDIDIKQ